MQPLKNIISIKYSFNCCITGVEDTNLALNKPTWQSSVEYNGISGLAVDGNPLLTDWWSWSCTHTSYESLPWWAVDLRNAYRLTTVKITNRGDCCGEWFCLLNSCNHYCIANLARKGPFLCNAEHHLLIFKLIACVISTLDWRQARLLRWHHRPRPMK